jgi:ubiquinone/menaquinone biosynthesis C-methylase UbiE
MASFTPSETIKAYDLPERVASYDADMDLMHPNRSKMLEVMLELLPIDRDAAFSALDLGVGTGFFSHAVLARFPNCRVIAVDGASTMIDMAKSRLHAMAARVDFRTGDFRHLRELLADGEHGRLVYSAYALHHLTPAEKLSVVRQAVNFLAPGGWFLNADLIVAADPRLERRIQEIRVEGIVRRAEGRDQRFINGVSTRAFLDDLEARDQDKPLTLGEDLEVLREAGLRNASAFWVEYREAVIGGLI